jgi:hypothetical protein
MLVGRWHDTFVHIPFGMVIGGGRKIVREGDLWGSVLEANRPTSAPVHCRLTPLIVLTARPLLYGDRARADIRRHQVQS